MLPVVLLAAVGLWAVVREIRVAEQEALRQTQAAADTLARRLRSELEAELREYWVLAKEHWMDFRLFSTVGFINWPTPEAPPPNASLDARIADWERRHPPLTMRELAFDSLGVATNGDFLTLADWPPAPVPPDWLARLSPEQGAQLRRAEALEAAGDLAAARTAWLEWRTNPPAAESKFLADFALARLTENPQAALEKLTFAGPTPVAASGLPLPALLLHERLRHPPATGKFADSTLKLISQAVTDHPSLLTPGLLALAGQKCGEKDIHARARIALLRQRWQGDERTRRVARLLRRTDVLGERLRSQSVWLLAGTRLEALCVLQPARYTNWNRPGRGEETIATEAQQATFLPATVLSLVISNAWHLNRDTVPAFAAARLQLAGADFAGTAWPTTAKIAGSAESHLQLPDGKVPFIVTLAVISPEAWQAALRRRSLWLGLLILAAAGTALLGLLVARKAYHRQLVLNQQKSNFVSAVSHELRAPIASVQLMVDNLEQGKVTDPERQREYFRLSGQECRRLGALVENVLDLARIEQGRKAYDFEPIHLPALARAQVRVMTPAAAEKRVTLREAPAAPNALEIIADGPSLQQALLNLLDNAIKYSPDDGTVTVGWEVMDANCRLWVADEGPGVPLAERERIFEWFYRTGSESHREKPGVGIGLALVRHTVADHGGRVWVEPNPAGPGSRFVVELPVAGPPPSLKQ